MYLLALVNVPTAPIVECRVNNHVHVTEEEHFVILHSRRPQCQACREESMHIVTVRAIQARPGGDASRIRTSIPCAREKGPVTCTTMNSSLPLRAASLPSCADTYSRRLPHCRHICPIMHQQPASTNQPKTGIYAAYLLRIAEAHEH
jgi:hypothetical protein